MNEIDERNCKEQITNARFQERANSITHIVVVGPFIAGAITHKRLYGWLFVLVLVAHLLRIVLDPRNAGEREYRYLPMARNHLSDSRDRGFDGHVYGERLKLCRFVFGVMVDRSVASIFSPQSLVLL